MTRILFVCTANICRSPYAELLATHRLGSGAARHGVDLASAGTHGWEASPMDETMAAELAGRGVDASGFRSRRLTPRLVDEADLVLTMSAAHRTFVLQERPVAVRKAFTLGQLAAALDDMEVTPGPELLAAARRVRPTAALADDVEDPYRRGPEVAARVAARIDVLLERVLPRLTR